MSLLHPGRGVGHRLNITDDAVAINNHRCGTLDKEGFLQPILLIDLTIGVRQNTEGEMQTITITVGFIYSCSEDDQHLEVAFLEVVIVSAQLGNMAAALQSIEFTHKEQVDVILVQVVG